MNSPLRYLPSSYFYRHAIDAAKNKREAIQIARQLVIELEMHKEWIRDHGLIPPKFLITRIENDAKAGGSVCLFPSIAPESAMGAIRARGR